MVVIINLCDHTKAFGQRASVGQIIEAETEDGKQAYELVEKIIDEYGAMSRSTRNLHSSYLEWLFRESINKPRTANFLGRIQSSREKWTDAYNIFVVEK